MPGRRNKCFTAFRQLLSLGVLSAQCPNSRLFSVFFFPWEGNLYVWARWRSLSGVIRFWGRIMKVQVHGTSRAYPHSSAESSPGSSSPSCLWGTKPLMWSAEGRLLPWCWLFSDFQLLEHIKQAFSQCYSASVAIGMPCACDWQGSQGHLSGDVMSAVREWKPWLICISQLQGCLLPASEQKKRIICFT